MKKKFAALLLVFSVCGVTAAWAAINDIPVTTSSKEARALFDKGLHLMDVGRAVESRSELMKAVEKDPSFSHAYFYLSIVALSPEEFKQVLEKGMSKIQGKSDGEKMLIEINQTFLDNDAAKRLQLAASLTEKYPNGPRAWMRLGFSQSTVNQHENARKAFAKALELSPALTGAHFALAFSYLFNEPKNFDKAEQHMRHCIRLEPNEAKGYEGLGDVLRAKNELEKAREAYTQATQKDPALSVAHLKKGHINSFLGRFQEARLDYDKGIAGAEEVNKINYANFKAFTYVHQGEPQTAVSELHKLAASADSLKIPKDQSDAIKLATLTNEVTVALHHNLFKEAEQILQEIGKATEETNQRVGDPDFARLQNANLLQLEGQLAARKGNYAAAQKKAEENRKLVEGDSNPRKLEGYYGLLAMMELMQKNYAKAVELYKKADLTNIYVQYQLGLAYEGVGNQAEAKKIFTDVSRWNFNTVTFALVRKDALRRAS